MATRNLHVIIGTSALGRAVMRELADRGERMRLVNRSGTVEGVEGVEVVAADASRRGEITAACDGAAIIYHCAMPRYRDWPELAPPLMEGILAAAAETGAKLVYGDNLYMYGPVDGPLVETLPHAPYGPNTRTRARLAEMAMEAHRDGRVRVAIGRGSDYYGPHATNSYVGDRVFGNALHGKPAEVLGDLDQPHSVTFIDDFGKALVLLGEHDRALGEAWHVPSGPARTLREFIAMIYEQTGHDPKFRKAPGWAIRLMGLFHPTMRAFAEVLYQSENPWVLDATKFVDAFGDIATPHEEAIRRTLDWYRAKA